jgi:cyclopropane fatty-acyl-phospholipid synthase-like methyltransferase
MIYQLFIEYSIPLHCSIQHVENIGYHYYPTLIHWRENFEANEE